MIPKSRPWPLARLCLIAVSLLTPSDSIGADDAPRPCKPNIVIMMADDMGIGDTSAYLGVRLNPDSAPIAKTLSTPNIERFAKSATVFTDGYAPASMCSSTRYSLLTGRFAHRSYLKYQGWLPHGPNAPMIQRELTTLPEMLQANGYRTAGVGKYHVGMAFDDGQGEPADDFFFHDVDFSKPLLDGPTHHGFDEYFGVPGNTEDPLDTEPRIFVRNDRFTFTDRKRMKLIGMKKRSGQILAAPDWDLKQLGPRYLSEVVSYIDRQSKSEQPFFLYYVPNANHFQRHPAGDYAVPGELAGVPIKGQSRYSDDTMAGDREDMVLENDTALGVLLRKLEDTQDPRWPGHKLIENTLIIFTSDNGPNTGDNLGRNQESGGLRGKKAKIWEGGIRVPFIVSWPAMLEGGKQNRSIVTLTDLYATLAHVVGHALGADEAQDSYNVFAHWTGQAPTPDLRPRVFFCHLGPPYLNDALAIRQGRYKLVVDGGLVMPWGRWSAEGARGRAKPTVFYDLEQNLYEEGTNPVTSFQDTSNDLADTLLKIHNRGHARDLAVPLGQELIRNPGWHNLRNDVTGEVGFAFELAAGSGSKVVTHLGIWDDHDSDRSVRAARAEPIDSDNDHPSRFASQKSRRGVAAPHELRLLRKTPNGRKEIASLAIGAGDEGDLDNAFRYFELKAPVMIEESTEYVLLMSTRAADGDAFRDPAAFDGLSPTIHPHVAIKRSLLFREEKVDELAIPSHEDLAPSYSHYRLPVGPTLRFAK